MTALVWVSCAMLLAVVFAANTHPHGEQTETDSIHFYYDPQMHLLVSTTRATCYMVRLTREESDHVHTNAGMEDLELRMMREWMGILTETKVYHDDASLPQNVRHWCGQHDIFLLERNVTYSSSTPPSAISG
ncbi:uncharacterized protein LOC127855142 [Dreissena polymorpha]|uniref:Uncharacterized protein n=1 Tax=Dreissena polymorpha TaxID=45954 RepID=A0A9D4C1J6_DREPO|nr:uncharacterized protein LOC127855142 [Dreissena polymorpha]XP_052246504.1 uncharacterized protein LOC127855142 [Dreissena polymorpha]KAH3715479.1 hypothetical protein DPMN_058190 [Dreissena polymorpha]